jgi:pimeloyl-ACP methyl ester carboxylesterase
VEIREQFIPIQGVRTHFYQAGESGSPVVLLHGGGADSAKLSWEEVIAPLAASGHRVFAPDLPGSGDSDRPDAAPYTIPYFIEFVGQFLSAAGLERASLMGLSLGGSISLGVALRWPERVERLVLVDSYGLQRKVRMHFLSWLMVKTPGVMEGSWALSRASREMSRWSLSTIFHDPKGISDALLDEALAEARKPHAGRAFTRCQRDEVFSNGLRTVYLDRLGEIKAPTLIVHGRDDIAVPLACAEEAHRLIPGSVLHVIPGAGHWSQREKPQEFIATVTDFLKD